MVRRLLPSAAVLLLGACASVPPPAPAPVEIGIVAINDFHGQLEPPNLAIRAPGTDVSVPAGGAAWLADAVETVRGKYRHSLTVAAGDLTGASQLASALFLDEPTIGVLNRIGLEFNAVGNHEFDRGVAELLRLQQGGCEQHTAREPCAIEKDFSGARFRYLAANVTDAEGRTLFPATAMKTFGEGDRRVSVGVIGLPLRDVPALVSPSGVAGWNFGDEAEAINRAVETLDREGADAVVVLIHQGLRTDQASGIDGCEGATDALVPILERIDPRVDVVVSGHTHWAYVCQWPTREPGDTVLVTSAGRYGTMLTDIALTIDPAGGGVVAKSAHNVIVQSRPFRDLANSDAVPLFQPDAEVASYVQRYVDAAVDYARRPVGRIAGPARKDGNAGGPLGNLIADAQLAATRGAGAQMALMNPGGIRADLVPGADGTVTFGDVYRVQPFGNQLVTVTLTGAELKAVLEQQFDSQGPETVLSVSQGFAFAYDRSRAEGDRIVAMTLEGRAIDPAAEYRVTVSNFLQGGGDFFTELTKGRSPTVGVLDLEALESWLDEEGARAVPTDERAQER